MTQVTAGGAPSRHARVLLTSNFSNTTGFAWKFFRRLQSAVARRLHEEGFGIALSFAKVEGEVRTIDPDIPFVVRAFDFHDHTPTEREEFLAWLAAERVEHVYFTDFDTWSPLFPAMRRAGVRRIVVHDHSSSALAQLPPRVGGLKGLAKAMRYRVPGLAADAVYACSDFVYQRLQRTARMPARLATVIHHGIDIERFDAPQRPSGADPVHIVCIARSVGEKGVDVLLRGVAALKTRGTAPFRVTYGGTGPRFDEFRGLARELGILDVVDFVGEVARSESVLREADIVVVPSVWGDAAPLSVLEAFATSRALVTTEVGGIPEQVGTPPCALLVPPSDPAALASALARLIADPALRDSLARQGRQRVESAFDERRFHREVIDHLLRDFGIGRAR